MHKTSYQGRSWRVYEVAYRTRSLNFETSKFSYDSSISKKTVTRVIIHYQLANQIIRNLNLLIKSVISFLSGWGLILRGLLKYIKVDVNRTWPPKTQIRPHKLYVLWYDGKLCVDHVCISESRIWIGIVKLAKEFLLP